jgi:hypothetical protein
MKFTWVSRSGNWVPVDKTHYSSSTTKQCETFRWWCKCPKQKSVTTTTSTTTTIAAECGVYSWPWQWFSLGRADVPFFLTSNRCIQIKNTLGWSTIVVCECKTIQPLSLVLCVVRAMNKFDFRLVINKTRNKWRPVFVNLLNPSGNFTYHQV